MGDGVEEGVLALVAADFADEEDGVEDDSGDEDGEEDDSEDEEGDAALVVDDPGDVEVMVTPTRIAPRVMKKAMAPRRRVMFMAWWKYSGVPPSPVTFAQNLRNR